MQIKILINNILELSYLIIWTNEKKFVRLTKGHPISKSTITREVYRLESLNKYKRF